MLNEDELKEAALLVFANKQDQPGAKGAGDISEALRLGELRDRNWSIVACSAVDGRGINEGMDWLVVSSTPEGFPGREPVLTNGAVANCTVRNVINIACIVIPMSESNSMVMLIPFAVDVYLDVLNLLAR